MAIVMKDIPAADRSDELVEELAQVWERSVRATHLFLTEEDIVSMRPEVRGGLAGVANLSVAYDDESGEGAPALGFAGVQEDVLEMLFIDAAARGKGVGKKLLHHAVNDFAARRLDVNEQNPQAHGFYIHEGFIDASRSEFDSEGRPFPIIHMELPEKGACAD